MNVGSTTLKAVGWRLLVDVAVCRPDIATATHRQCGSETNALTNRYAASSAFGTIITDTMLNAIEIIFSSTEICSNQIAFFLAHRPPTELLIKSNHYYGDSIGLSESTNRLIFSFCRNRMYRSESCVRLPRNY